MGDVFGMDGRPPPTIPCRRCGDRYPPGSNPDGLEPHACDAPPEEKRRASGGVDPGDLDLDAAAARVIASGVADLEDNPSAYNAAALLSALASYRRASKVEGTTAEDGASVWFAEGKADGA